LVNKIIPLGDEVINGASSVGLAEGGSTVHATSGLHLKFEGGVCDFVVWDRVDFSPIHDTLQRGSVGFRITFIIQKPTKIFDAIVSSITASYSESF
jgi:hypothetical protein